MLTKGVGGKTSAQKLTRIFGEVAGFSGEKISGKPSGRGGSAGGGSFGGERRSVAESARTGRAKEKECINEAEGKKTGVGKGAIRGFSRAQAGGIFEVQWRGNSWEFSGRSGGGPKGKEGYKSETKTPPQPLKPHQKRPPKKTKKKPPQKYVKRKKREVWEVEPTFQGVKAPKTRQKLKGGMGTVGGGIPEEWQRNKDEGGFLAAARERV